MTGVCNEYFVKYEVWIMFFSRKIHHFDGKHFDYLSRVVRYLFVDWENLAFAEHFS